MLFRSQHPYSRALAAAFPTIGDQTSRMHPQGLAGDPPEGEAMPSVRTLASRYLLNPLTVSRALQALDEDGLLENRRGLGLFVRPGARERLRQAARQRFLADEWPALRARLQRLGISEHDLDWTL